MHRRFLYHLQGKESYLGNFAHNIGQRIVLNHAIVYNEAVHGYIPLQSNFMRTSTVVTPAVAERLLATVYSAIKIGPGKIQSRRFGTYEQL